MGGISAVAFFRLARETRAKAASKRWALNSDHGRCTSMRLFLAFLTTLAALSCTSTLKPSSSLSDRSTDQPIPMETESLEEVRRRYWASRPPDAVLQIPAAEPTPKVPAAPRWGWSWPVESAREPVQNEAVVPNAYGLGVNRDQFGRPHAYRLENGAPVAPIFQGGVRRDVYGPGVHMDQFGRPVYDGRPGW